ncbi:MAG: hypothetical protein QNI91_01640 [Arenicellales bacterium]|nr:hypothetical protein [Arenicellales bacterium]
MNKERTFVAVCRVRGLFSRSLAKKRGARIANDFAKKGAEVIPAIEGKSPTSCELSVLVSCDKSLEEKFKERLGLLNFDFRHVNVQRFKPT